MNTFLIVSQSSAVNFKNTHTSLFIRVRKLNLSIETPTTKQSRIQNIGSVGSRNHLRSSPVVREAYFDSRIGAEAIQLVKQLQKSSMDFTVVIRATTSLQTHSIQLWRVASMRRDHTSSMKIIQPL